METYIKKYIDIIKKIPLFDDLNEDQLQLILGCVNAKITECEKNCMLFKEGDKALKIGVVLSGSVQVERYGIDGTRDIITIITAPNLFGEAYAFADLKILPVSVVAAEKSTVMLLDGSCINDPCSNLCDFHYTLIKNLLRIIANKNLVLTQKISLMSKKTTREKLLSYLTSEAKRQKSCEFNIPYNRQELADYLGVERSAMSAELGRLCKDGIIETKRSRFKLFNYNY